MSMQTSQTTPQQATSRCRTRKINKMTSPTATTLAFTDYYQIAQYQLQHWVLSRLLARKVALREKRTSTTHQSTTSTRRPPPRHVCARHDDRESDRQDSPLVATPMQEQIDALKLRVGTCRGAISRIQDPKWESLRATRVALEASALEDCHWCGWIAGVLVFCCWSPKLKCITNSISHSRSTPC